MAKANFSLEIPIVPFDVPDRVWLESPVSPKHEGLKLGKTVPLSEVDAQTLDNLCEKFTEDIFAKAGKERPQYG